MLHGQVEDRGLSKTADVAGRREGLEVPRGPRPRAWQAGGWGGRPAAWALGPGPSCRELILSGFSASAFGPDESPPWEGLSWAQQDGQQPPCLCPSCDHQKRHQTSARAEDARLTLGQDHCLKEESSSLTSESSEGHVFVKTTHTPGVCLLPAGVCGLRGES